MFSRMNIATFEDYFLPYSERNTNGVYFCRLTAYCDKIHKQICRYIEAAETAGVCISQKIKNPDERQLAYYEEMMGREFSLNPNFFIEALSRWIPRVREESRKDIAYSFFELFQEMGRAGKNESIQRNTYIKFMCWLYYMFEPVLQQLGKGTPPKIIFDGMVTTYELLMFRVLSKIGCDILLLEYDGEDGYLRLDPKSQYSQLLKLEGVAFPKDYSILEIRKKLKEEKMRPKVQLPKTEKAINTNTWMSGNVLEDVLKEQSKRGSDSHFWYNLFAGIDGAEDTGAYYMELLKWKMKLDDSGRKVLLLENGFPSPSFEETNQVIRRNYSDADYLLQDMVRQIQIPDKNVEAYFQSAFMECMKERRKESLQRLVNTAVMMVCWIRRYARILFVSGSKEPLLLYYGEVKSEKEAIFLSILAKTPMDVLLINPEAKEPHPIGDKLFFLKKQTNRVGKQQFPTNASSMQVQTVAYEAERQLDTLMYQDTGMYRNKQFQKAIPVTMQITYEEIALLWKEEAKYRPNFEAFTDRVMIPVIFAKVSGVKDSVASYWESVSELIDENTYVIRGFPFLSNNGNPYKDKTYLYLDGERINVNKIKNSTSYPFGILRENMQNMMLEKAQQLIDSKVIEGTGINGMEHVIVSTILNLDRRLLRMIQNYDFTRTVPKVVVIHTKDATSTPQDSILLAYLNLLGFDIVLFVPTGYISVERYYTKALFVEHQVGDYKYDLQIPDLKVIRRRKEGFATRFFKRGR